MARELQERCPIGWTLTALGRNSVDLTHPSVCAAAIATAEADVIINAAAYTAVDRAEREADLAMAVNAVAPAAMAQAAAARGIPFLQLSTDYVFDGSGAAAGKPDDVPDPQNVYGRSKHEGERAVVQVGAQYVILRTSWVFSAHGQNFVKTMLRLGRERDRLRIVFDQIGGPTPAAAIADALFTIGAKMVSEPSMRGTYHFAGSPDTSWADFAREIFDQAGMVVDVIDIATLDYPTPARRPLNSRLDCTTLQRDFELLRPCWRAGLRDVLDRLDAE